MQGIPKLFGDDGGISQPPARAVSTVNLLNMNGGVGMRRRAFKRVWSGKLEGLRR